MITEFLTQYGQWHMQTEIDDRKERLLQILAQNTNDAGKAEISFQQYEHEIEVMSKEAIRLQCLQLCHIFISQGDYAIRLMNGITINEETIQLNWSYSIHPIIFKFQQKINSCA